MFRKYLLLILLPLLAVSCSDDDLIWDFINPGVEFIIRDGQGRDLLDPEVPGNILDNEITVTYEGEQYLWTGVNPETRESMPLPLALRVRYSESHEAHILEFGEFSPQGNYRDESFSISWGDGTTDQVAFDLYLTWKKKNPTVHKKVSLNGEAVPGDSLLLEIVK